ncbi:P-loop NTPase fold protein [Streptococcus sp. ZY19097]|uniref:P-loop NTPase fold protein n=1 Tax=Streptococcus sp. ZY19097 TaxID=3231906 RepID=UPI00345AE4D3
MEYLNNAIENYINGTDGYALQIDGDWGSGKTYYLKNNMQQKFKSKHKTIYFSVYGYDKLSELKKDLLYKIFMELEESPLIKKAHGLLGKIKTSPWISDNMIFSSVGLLSDYILEYMKDKKLAETSNKVIVIIDDLERLSGKLQIQDVLGFILNGLLETLRCRVIIVSNSKEISFSDKYKKIKEKVIGRTIHFNYDERGLKEIISSKSQSDFIKQNLDWVLDILSISYRNIGEVNLRTLFSIVDNFEFVETKLFSEINKLLEERNLEIKKSIFLNIFVITNEYKQGGLSDGNLPELKSHNFQRFFWTFGDDNSEKIMDKIIKKYHNKNPLFDALIVYSDVLNEYVLNGVWNTNNYVNSWESTFYPNRKMQAYESLQNFRRFSDSEIHDLQEQAVCEVINNDYSYKELLRLYDLLYQFKKLDLLFIEADKLDIVREEFIKMIQNEGNNSSTIESLRDEIVFSGITDVELKNRISELIKKPEEQNQKNKNLQLLDAIFKDDNQAVKKITNNTPFVDVNIFKYILEYDYVESYMLCIGSKADYLMSYINTEYLHISNAKDFHHEEIPDIRKLVETIDDKIDSVELERIDRFKIRQLRERLLELEKHLS